MLCCCDVVKLYFMDSCAIEMRRDTAQELGLGKCFSLVDGTKSLAPQ